MITFDKYNQADTGDVGCTLGAGSKAHNNAHLPHVCGPLTGGMGKGPRGTEAVDGGHLVAAIAHTLRPAGCDASEDGTGRGTPLVVTPQPYTLHGNVDECAAVASADDTAQCLRARVPGTIENSSTTVVAFHENQRHEITTSDTAGSLKVGGGKPGQGYPAIRDGMVVRRLTPTECERLQGLPDDWTAGQSDSARYRQIGNGGAVPVMEWLGRRILEANP